MSQVKLYGFPISNYYNKVKYALLYKNIEFEEVRTDPKSKDPEWRRKSPMGKIPVLEWDGVFVFESNVILEFIEEKVPEPSLIGNSPEKRAELREWALFLDLYIDLSARPCYDMAFRGKEPVESIVEKGFLSASNAVEAMKLHFRFEPFLFGDKLSIVDLSAFAHLSLCRDTFIKLGKGDLFQGWAEMEAYLQMLESLPISKKVNSARKAVLRMQAMAEK